MSKKAIVMNALRDGLSTSAAARLANTTPSYVSRIKREMLNPPDVSAIVEVQTSELVQPEDGTNIKKELQEIIPANITAIVQLRDALIENLNEKINHGTLSGKAAVDLMGILLKYEAELRQVTAPQIALIEDNSQHLTINNLADKMDALNVDDLRSLAGVAEAIDVTPTEVE